MKCHFRPRKPYDKDMAQSRGCRPDTRRGLERLFELDRQLEAPRACVKTWGGERPQQPLCLLEMYRCEEATK